MTEGIEFKTLRFRDRRLAIELPPRAFLLIYVLLTNDFVPSVKTVPTKLLQM